jgi:hypothetical protein
MEVALAFTIAMVALALSLRRSVGGKQELSSM